MRKLLGLGIRGTEKIPGVGIAGIDLGDAPECVDGGLRVSSVLGQQAEAVPRVRILRVLLESVIQGDFGLIDLLKIQVGDANVQARDCQCGIGFDRGLERLQALFEKLLVHVGHAEIVEARGFDGIRSFRLSLRDGGEESKGG